MATNYQTNEKVDQLSNSDEDLLETIKCNFKIAEEMYSDQRVQAREDFEFRNGEQWPSNIRNQREKDGRPCLRINKLPQFIKQVVNNQKINRPSINVNPNDSQASIDTAKVFQAIIKNIEAQSMAENSYDTAFDNAVTCGEGYFRIATGYSDPLSFDMDIQIKSIDNSFSVYIDPSFNSDFSGINWAFVFDNMDRDEFKRNYPDSSCSTGDLLVNSGDDWIGDNEVRIAEYFYIELERFELVKLKNGEEMDKKDFEALNDENRKNNPIMKERDSHRKKVKWVKTNGHEILEREEFPGEMIPIVPVFADTYMKEGRRIFEGVVRQAKDAQRAYNYWYSAETEMIALAPKATYIGAVGQFEGVENQWNNINNSNLPYLEYNPVSSGGQQAPAPVRTQFDPQISSILTAKQAANEDLKATTGIYDPSLGKEMKEASGRALMTKQRQAEVTNFLYGDNLCKSLKYAGKILLNMIPVVYDTQRVVRIKGGVNQDDEMVIVNAFDEKKPVFLNVGKYDIDVSIGPYGENQRQESIDSMLALMQINPQLSSLIGDIFVSKMDWDGSKEISERLKIMLPQQLQSDQELPPEIQAQVMQAKAQYEQQIAQQDAQLQQMQQLIANLTAEANQAKADANNKQAEIESKERIAAMNARVKLLEIGIKEEATDNRLAFQQELSYTQARQQGQVNIPKQGDEYVLSGVNDPVTEAQEQQNGELSAEEEQDLMAKLQNFTPQTTQM